VKGGRAGPEDPNGKRARGSPEGGPGLETVRVCVGGQPWRRLCRTGCPVVAAGQGRALTPPGSGPRALVAPQRAGGVRRGRCPL